MTRATSDTIGVIIDSHVHLGCYGRFRIRRPDDEGLIQTLDRCGIACACVSHNLALAADWRAGNQQTLDAMTRNPGRIAGYFVVNPHAAAAEMHAEMDRFFAHPGACGLKIHTSLQSHPFSGPGYDPALRYAHDHHLAILVHGWEGPQVLKDIAARFASARFVLAHAGATWNGRDEDANLRAAQELANVWVDICGSAAHFGALPRLVELLGPRKILWGTDCVWFDPSGALMRVLAAPLADEVKSMITGGNAIAVLRLEQWLKRAA